jgi:transposase
MKKRDPRKLKAEALEELRRQAIRLWKAGKNYRQIGELLEIHYNTISLWIRRYESEGIKSIRLGQRGRRHGQQRVLDAAQEKEVMNLIENKLPDQLQLAFALWTRKAVCELVLRLYGITLPVRSCGEYLQRWGFTPQKPARRAYEQNPLAVQAWMKERYPEIQRQAKQENAEIHWGDESAVRNDCQHIRGYSPRGKTPVLAMAAKRFSLNMISSVTNQGKVRWMIYRDTLDASMLIRFLERLIKGSNRKILLILDNLRVHHSRAVRAWLQEHTEQIQLFFLPAYSQELNPDEYLNGDVKQTLGQLRPPKNQKELESNVKSHLRRLRKLPQRWLHTFTTPTLPMLPSTIFNRRSNKFPLV